MSEIDYGKIFECLPDITGLPFVRSRNRAVWYGSFYLDGVRHERRDKTLAMRSFSGGIILIEQGGSPVQLFKWLRDYKGMNDRAVFVMLESFNGKEIKPYTPPELPPMKYVYSDVLREKLRLIGAYPCNLFTFLCKHYPEEKVRAAFRLYYVTPFVRRDGIVSTNFWYVNSESNIMHDKCMIYDENGKRNKEKPPTRKFKREYGYYGSCCFGSHLLGKCEGKKVFVVESEKTALLMYLEYNVVCIATGGSNYLSEIRDNWVLMPDFDNAGMGWVDKYPVQSKQWWNDFQCLVDYGDDIGDIILKQKTPKF